MAIAKHPFLFEDTNSIIKVCIKLPSRLSQVQYCPSTPYLPYQARGLQNYWHTKNHIREPLLPTIVVEEFGNTYYRVA